MNVLNIFGRRGESAPSSPRGGAGLSFVLRWGTRFALILAAACSDDEEKVPLCTSTEAPDLVLTRADNVKQRATTVLADINSALQATNRLTLDAHTRVVLVLSAADDPRLDIYERDGLVADWGGSAGSAEPSAPDQADATSYSADASSADASSQHSSDASGSADASSQHSSDASGSDADATGADSSDSAGSDPAPAGIQDNVNNYGVGRTSLIVVPLDPAQSGLDHVEAQGLPVTAVQCAADGDGVAECVSAKGVLEGQKGPLRIFDTASVYVDGKRLTVSVTENSQPGGGNAFDGRVIVTQVDPSLEYPGAGACTTTATPTYDGSKSGIACDLDALNSHTVYDYPNGPYSEPVPHSNLPHTKTPSQECSVMVDALGEGIAAAIDKINKASATTSQ